MPKSHFSKRFEVAFWIGMFLHLVVSETHAQTENESSEYNITVIDNGKTVNVTVGNKPFTSYDYSKFKKPIFYPVLGPKQTAFTRNWPLKDVDGESNDHPHHKSIWAGHEINGVDFWSEKGGSVKLTKLETHAESFEASHDWIKDEDDSVVVSDLVEVNFGAGDNHRYIDYEITFNATNDPVVFEDTKEGLFAVRVAPGLRHTPDKKQSGNTRGSMRNNTGNSGKTIWGQKARWVNYFGKIDGVDCGIAVFDHPENLRHPTTWHARDYGLLAANPFGLHYFQKQKKRAGEFKLEPGDSLSLRYRVLLYANSLPESEIDSHYNVFANRTGTKK